MPWSLASKGRGERHAGPVALGPGAPLARARGAEPLGEAHGASPAPLVAGAVETPSALRVQGDELEGVLTGNPAIQKGRLLGP